MSVMLFADSYIPDGVTTYSSQAAGYPGANVLNLVRRGKVWRTTGCASEWIKFDLGTSYNPKGLFIIGDRNQGLKLSDSAVVTLQANHTDAWGSPAFSKVLKLHAKVIQEIGETGIFDSAYRYVRITFADPTNPLGYVELNGVYLGAGYLTDRGGVQFGMSRKQIDNSETITTESGATLTEKGTKTQSIQGSWNALTHQGREAILSIWNSVGTDKPFFAVLDPKGVFSSVSNEATYLVKFEQEPDDQLVSIDNYSMNMRLREHI